MSIGDERNRPRVVDHVQNIHVHANHYRYGAKYSIRWKSSVDSESSEVDGDQKLGPYIIKGTVKHNHLNVGIIHAFDSEVGVWKLGVSDRAEGVDGTYIYQLRQNFLLNGKPTTYHCHCPKKR